MKVSHVPLRYANAMPVNFNEVEYYGRGPGETMLTVTTAADLGIYRQTVDEQFYSISVRRKPEPKRISAGGKLNAGGNGLQGHS